MNEEASQQGKKGLRRIGGFQIRRNKNLLLFPKKEEAN